MKVLIVTVTLNPAIDRTVALEGLTVDKVNRVKSVRRDAGGKGINVSKTIKALGGHSKALVVLGGENGKWLRSEVARLGIDMEVVQISGETRENIKLVDLLNEKYTDLNERGPESERDLEEKLIQTIERDICAGDFLILAGSPLPDMDTAIFYRLCKYFKNRGVKVVLDVDGPYLSEAIPAGPYLIKPNQDELSAYKGFPIESEEALISVVSELIKSGVENVAVSRGEDGLLFMDRQYLITAKALKVEVKSTVGAGDAVVAALVKGLSEENEKSHIIKTAVATATSVIMQTGSQTGNLSNLEELMQLIEVTVKPNPFSSDERSLSL